MVGSLDDRERQFSDLCESIPHLVPRITTIGEDVPQPRIEPADRSQYAGATITVLDIGWMHEETNQIALRVGYNVAFAPLDLFAGVVAARAAAFRGFHRLAVDDARRRLASRPACSRAAITSV